MRVLIVGGISTSLINFRGPLIRTMIDQGHEVIACAGETQREVTDTLKKWGVTYIPLTLARAGMRPLEDLRTFIELFGIVKRLRPEVILCYTIKPVIWGGLAARMGGISDAYSLITGLGYTFMGNSTSQRLIRLIVKKLYASSLKYSRKVFLQNPDDRDMLINFGLVKWDQAIVVHGSGVDLNHFSFSLPMMDGELIKSGEGYRLNESVRSSIPSRPEIREHSRNSIRFLLIARLLRDKGICEYLAAAKIIRKDYPQTTFHLVGDYDPNPTGLQPEEIEKWIKAGILDYHGKQKDVRQFLKEAHVYVLPSYREGIPRTVLEAMATGRPVITTDAPGCRETVKLSANGLEQRKKGDAVMEGENGFLVRSRDVAAIASAMSNFLKDPTLISRMGHRGREIAAEKYDVHKVNKVMLEHMGLLKKVSTSEEFYQ